MTLTLTLVTLFTVRVASFLGSEMLVYVLRRETEQYGMQ